MYFGSVRFFQHCIIVTIIIVIVTLAGTVLSLDAKNKLLSEEIKNLTEIVNMMAQNTDSTSDASLSSTSPSKPPPLVDELEPDQKVTSSDTQTVQPSPDTSPSFPYQIEYPELYAEFAGEYEETSDHTVYLTFDGGVSDNTSAILDVLKEKNVKATFFIVGSQCEDQGDMLQRIVDEGHILAIHTYSDKYRQIYRSVDAFLEDFDRCFQLIYDETGVKPSVFRFPGGSINGYNHNTYQPIIAEMTRRGFTYYDWHFDAQGVDRSLAATMDAMLLKVEYFAGSVLLFDDQKTSANALIEVIDMLTEHDFTFNLLTNEVRPTVFTYSMTD